MPFVRLEVEMDDVYAFLHNDTRNVAEWGPHAHSRSPLPPHVGPLTAELGTTVWEGRVNTRRLCPAHRDCAQAARAGLGKYTILIFVQVKFNCREVISNHLSNNRLKKDSNRRIAISSVLNGWRITRSEERQQTRAEPARQRVARRRERASEQRRAKARARS